MENKTTALVGTVHDEAKTRKYWIQWIGYIMREHESNEVDFMQLLAREYEDWAEQVLGWRRPLHQYAITPANHLRLAVRAASLPKLLELYAIRYILQHPVPDGVPYADNCQRVPVMRVTARRVAKNEAAGAPTKEGRASHE